MQKIKRPLRLRRSRRGSFQGRNPPIHPLKNVVDTLVLSRLPSRQLPTPPHSLPHVHALTLVLCVECRLLIFRVTPVVPPFRYDVWPHPSIKKNGTSVWAPRATQVDVSYFRSTREGTISKNEPVP